MHEKSLPSDPQIWKIPVAAVDGQRPITQYIRFSAPFLASVLENKVERRRKGQRERGRKEGRKGEKKEGREEGREGARGEGRKEGRRKGRKEEKHGEDRKRRWCRRGRMKASVGMSF